MLPENVDELAERYLQEELGLTKEEAQASETDLLGFFDVLLRIDKRLKSETV